MDVLVKSPAEIWDALQGKAKMRAGDGTENPQPGTLAREFSIFIETPLFHDPEASSLLAREDCSVRPTLQSIEEVSFCQRKALTSTVCPPHRSEVQVGTRWQVQEAG